VYQCQAGTVADFVESLEDKGGNRANIEIVSMDKSSSFISGVMEYLPAAQMIFDKFHLVQLLNNALDEVRKAERKGNDLLKGHKYTVLKKCGNLSGQKSRNWIMYG
jgi:transposase